MAFITTKDQVRLYYEDWGTGHPVVLLHGWPLDAASWEYQALHLAAAGYRVITYDRRGFGRSDRPWGGYDYDTLAADLDALVRALDLHEAALVGFSMGGGEVARYLSTYGAARVSRVVLLAAVTPGLAQAPDRPEGVPGEVFDGLFQALEQDRIGFLGAYSKTVFRPDEDETVNEARRHWYLDMALRASPRAVVETARSWAGTDFRQDMRAFTIPTLVIHGAEDTSVPPALAGRASARMIPGARYLEYPQAGHFLIVDEAARVTRDVLDFLGSEPAVGEPGAEKVDEGRDLGVDQAA
ncbi:MAG: alpha/beta hydrolase [Castellaniella sp.]|uniref:alpha/beta fold hydrolase n=1 Tax=Castellaniella sp. TaxID=1955812 RepID=UPI003C774758